MAKYHSAVVSVSTDNPSILHTHCAANLASLSNKGGWE